MTPFGSPEFWSGLSGPGIATLAAVWLTVALVRGWLVTGKQHDAIVTRGQIDAESVRALSIELANKNGAELLSSQILAALRESVAAKGER